MEVAWAEGVRTVGRTRHMGWVVLRPGWVAFLPTRLDAAIKPGLAWATNGFITFHGFVPSYDLRALESKGEAAFDQAVTALALVYGVVWSTEDATVVVDDPGGGGLLTVTFSRSKDLTLSAKYEATEVQEVLGGWLVHVPVFDALKEARQWAVISAFPALFALLCGIAALSGFDPSLWWGVPFWGVAVLGCWAFFLARWWHYRQHPARQLTAEKP